MSYCKEDGKDKMIFVTEQDHSAPCSIELPDDDTDEEEGLIKANGEINWDCPCLQGMAYGPCGEQFRSAFSCFHYSDAEVKGSDCIDQFRDMQQCFVKYPEIYGRDDEEDEKNKEQEKAGNDSEKEVEQIRKVVSETDAASDEAIDGRHVSASPSRAVIAAQANHHDQPPENEGQDKSEQRKGSNASL